MVELMPDQADCNAFAIWISAEENTEAAVVTSLEASTPVPAAAAVKPPDAVVLKRVKPTDAKTSFDASYLLGARQFST